MSNITFTIIKPDATESKKEGLIINDIINANFEIAAIKKIHLTKKQAQKFYLIHKEKPFYKELVEFMSSYPVYVAIIKKENAVKEFRNLIGATNPQEAKEGTIRKKYAKSLGENAIHGSDSNENAIIESKFFFSDLEVL